MAGCLYSALWPLLTSARWPVSCPHWPVPGPLVLWQVDPSRLCVRRRVSCSLFFDRSLRLGSALGWSARGCLGAIAGVSLGFVAGCSCSVLWPMLTSALWPVSCPYWPVSCTRFWLISAAGWSTLGCLGPISGVRLQYAQLVYSWGSPTLLGSPGSIPGALRGLSWGSPGSLLGLFWASPGALLGLSWGSPGTLLGLSWGSPGPLLGLSWGSPGAVLGLLVKHSVLKKGPGATQAQTLVKQSVLAARLT